MGKNQKSLQILLFQHQAFVFIGLMSIAILIPGLVLTTLISISFVVLYIFILRFKKDSNYKNQLIFFIIIGLAYANIIIPITPIFKSLPEFLLILFAFFSIILYSKKYSLKTPIAQVLMLILFFVGGFVTTAINDARFLTWYTVCVTPIIIFYCIKFIKVDINSVKLLIFTCNLSNIFLLALVVVGFLTGGALAIDRGLNVEKNAALTADLNFGPFVFWIGGHMFSIAQTFLLPANFVSVLTTKKKKEKLLSLSFLIVNFALMLMVGARASILSSLITMGMIIVALFYYRVIGLSSLKTYFTIFAVIAGVFFVTTIGRKEMLIDRFQEFNKEKTEFGMYQYRKTLMDDAINNNGVFGIGFDKLWSKYEIDEANLYSWTLNGVGYMGFIGIMGFILICFKSFLTQLIFNKQNRDIQIIGLFTLICPLLASFSDNALFNYPMYCIPFWAIIAILLRYNKELSMKVKVISK